MYADPSIRSSRVSVAYLPMFVMSSASPEAAAHFQWAKSLVVFMVMSAMPRYHGVPSAVTGSWVIES